MCWPTVYGCTQYMSAIDLAITIGSSDVSDIRISPRQVGRGRRKVITRRSRMSNAAYEWFGRYRVWRTPGESYQTFRPGG